MTRNPRTTQPAWHGTHDAKAERDRLILDTLEALRRARRSLYGYGGTGSPFGRELDRLINLYENAIKLAEDLREAQCAKMASQPYTLADVLPEPANISTAPSTMPAAAKWFLAVTLASVGVLMCLGVFQLVQLLTE